MNKTSSYTKSRKFRKLHLSLIFALVVFLIMLISLAMVLGLIMLLSHFGSLPDEFNGHVPFFYFSFVSLIIGAILAFVLSDRPLRPIRELMNATDRIASGDYSVRLDLKGPDEFRELSDKFNHMAEELGSVEMLRSDFVSNFSHEFKTPIVSIRGFAKALKWEGLSKEEQYQYLDIIIEESERLSDLSANVLYLSRIEQQTLLTDRKTFNLTEQIRLVAALLDKKITDKQLTLSFECEEHQINGNEEMLKQVWINLLDNAIKFTPEGGTIEITMKQHPDSISVIIFNEGTPIPEETASRIFEKFYQGDTSHSTPGNGLGLAIVKKIVDLHDGSIHVYSSDQGNIFEVIIPLITSAGN